MFSTFNTFSKTVSDYKSIVITVLNFLFSNITSISAVTTDSAVPSSYISAVSLDGTRMIFFDSQDVLSSVKTNGVWSTPEATTIAVSYGSVLAIAISDDGTRAMALNGSKNIISMYWPTGISKPVVSIISTASGFSSCSMTPDGSTVAIVSNTLYTSTWSTSSNQFTTPVATLVTNGLQYGVAISPDASIIVCCNTDGNAFMLSYSKKINGVYSALTSLGFMADTRSTFFGGSIGNGPPSYLFVSNSSNFGDATVPSNGTFYYKWTNSTPALGTPIVFSLSKTSAFGMSCKGTNIYYTNNFKTARAIIT
jgi:hypothetical protein